MNRQSLTNRNRGHLLLLALIVALACLLRLFNISSLGFWTDEFCSLSCANSWGLQFDKPPLNQVIAADIPAEKSADKPGMPPAVVAMTRLASARSITRLVPSLANDEAHPPLYFILLRAWESLLGDSERAVRSLNVLFSVLAIVLLFFTARDSVGAATALWACLLMAVAQPQIQFSQEARNYMPVVTFSLLAVLAIQRLKRQRSSTAAALLCASMLAMMLTHYFAAGVTTAIAIYGIFTVRRRSRRLVITTIAISAALYLLLWGPFLVHQRANMGSNYTWISDTAPLHLARTGKLFLDLPWKLIAQIPPGKIMPLFADVCGITFYLGAVIVCIRRPELRNWGLCFFASIVLVTFVDLWRSTAQLGLLRYTLFASPAEYVLIASMIQRGHFRNVLPAFAIAGGLLGLKSAYSPPWKTDFETPVEIIAHQFHSGDGLVIVGPDPIADGVMFAAFRHYIQTMPITAVMTESPNDLTLASLRECHRVFVVRLWSNRSIPLPGFLPDSSPESVPYFIDVETGRFIDIHPSPHATPATR